MFDNICAANLPDMFKLEKPWDVIKEYPEIAWKVIKKLHEENEQLKKTVPILKHRGDHMRANDYWLTKDGRDELRVTCEDLSEGDIILFLLNELEKLENLIDTVQGELWIDGDLSKETKSKIMVHKKSI